jgi:hypothetical protein
MSPVLPKAFSRLLKNAQKYEKHILDVEIISPNILKLMLVPNSFDDLKNILKMTPLPLSKVSASEKMSKNLKYIYPIPRGYFPTFWSH